MNMKTTETNRTLYKKDSKGNVRVWSKELGSDATTGEFAHRTTSGLRDGKTTTSGWEIVTQKNVGRANETSLLTQARFEIEADYTKKLKTGYFENIDDIGKLHYTKPMLATEWSKRKDKIDITAGVFLQPKFDGLRCIARADGLWTRTGKPITSCQHIFDALAPFFAEDPGLIFDGELYNHDLRDDFNTLVSLIRKLKPNADQSREVAAAVQYHIYDLPSSTGTYVDRGTELDDLKWRFDGEVIRSVVTNFANSFTMIESRYAEIIGEGYEGMMIRLDDTYKNGRSNSLIKRKDFITEEFPVVSVSEGLGNWAGHIKQFEIRLPDGRTCGSGVRGKQNELEMLFLSKETPDWATVRYFELTPDGVPRFPVVVDYFFGERED